MKYLERIEASRGKKPAVQEVTPAIDHPVTTAVESVVSEIENHMPAADIETAMEEHDDGFEKPNVMNICRIDEDDDDELYDEVNNELEDEYEDEE